MGQQRRENKEEGVIMYKLQKYKLILYTFCRQITCIVLTNCGNKCFLMFFDVFQCFFNYMLSLKAQLTHDPTFPGAAVFYRRVRLPNQDPTQNPFVAPEMSLRRDAYKK